MSIDSKSETTGDCQSLPAGRGKRTRLCELPGWEESLREVNATLHRPLLGDVVRIIGAFVPPPSVRVASPWLVYNLAVALDEHRWGLRRREREEQERRELAAPVVNLAEYRRRRYSSPCLEQLNRAREVMPYRPISETVPHQGRERPPWAPSGHEGNGAS